MSFTQNPMNYQNILNSDPQELFMWIQNEYMLEIPTQIDNPDELAKAGNRLGELINIYSYLMSMTTLANLNVKEKKKNKEDKDSINKAIGIRDVLQNSSDIIKAQYTAISRMISVRKQVADEINMH